MFYLFVAQSFNFICMFQYMNLTSIYSSRLECLWVYDVEEFGPLTITIDTHGGNFTEDSKKNIAANRDKILQELE